MPTLIELRNEMAESATKMAGLVDDPVAFKAAQDDWTAKRGQYERAEAAEGAQKFATERMPAASELRNPGDADWVPEKKGGPDELDPDGVMLKSEHGGTGFMPYARPGREGWIKGLPVSSQHPSILKRLPDELQRKNALEKQAMDLYLRRGVRGFRDNEKLFAHLKDLQENTDSEGGYLVPTDQRTDIIVPPGTPGGVIRRLASVSSTTRDGGTWPRLSTDVTMAAIAEEAAGPESDPAFGQVPFTIHKVGRNVDLSDELLSDSAVNIPALLGARFSAAKGRYEDQQAIEGDGTTEPLGLRTTGWATISDVTNLWTLAAPTALQVMQAFYELPAEYRENLSWHMTSSLFVRILGIGTTAAGVHLVDTIGDAVAPRILGRPVYFFDGTGWDDAATIGANEELGAVGNFQAYQFLDRMGLSVSRSDDVAFRTDQVVFKARVRYDSLFTDANAFRVLKAAAS